MKTKTKKRKLVGNYSDVARSRANESKRPHQIEVEQSIKEVGYDETCKRFGKFDTDRYNN